MKKILKNLIFAVILLVVVGLVVYYFLPKEPKDPMAEFFEFKIISQDLSAEELAEYQQRFVAVKQSLIETPDQLDGWLQLGMLKKFVGDYQGAEAAWIKAGELRPKNSTSFGNLADLYVNFSKEYDKAELAYQKAIENSQGEAKNVNFYRNYYYFAYYNLADFNKTESILLAGLADNPKSSDMPALLGSFYSETGKISQAIEYYQKALELNPDNATIKAEIERLKNEL